MAPFKETSHPLKINILPDLDPGLSLMACWTSSQLYYLKRRRRRWRHSINLRHALVWSSERLSTHSHLYHESNNFSGSNQANFFKIGFTTTTTEVIISSPMLLRIMNTRSSDSFQETTIFIDNFTFDKTSTTTTMMTTTTTMTTLIMMMIVRKLRRRCGDDGEVNSKAFGQDVQKTS